MKLLNDTIKVNGKYSQKRVTTAISLFSAIIYAFLPIYFINFEVKEFIFLGFLGAGGFSLYRTQKTNEKLYSWEGKDKTGKRVKGEMRGVGEASISAHLRRQGQRYGDGLVEILAGSGLPATVWGEPSRLAVRWHDVSSTVSKEVLRTWWLAEHARRGILLGIGVVFPQASWGDAQVDRLLMTAEEVVGIMLHALETKTLMSACPCPIIMDVLPVRR